MTNIYTTELLHKEAFDRLDDVYEHVFAMLYNMKSKADSFCK
jgi:hypothetical protein